MSFKFLINIFFLTTFLLLNSCSSGITPTSNIDTTCLDDPKWFQEKKCPKGYECVWAFESSIDRAASLEYAAAAARDKFADRLSSGAGGITQKTLQEGKNNMNQNEIKSLEAYNDLFKSDFWITEAKQDFRNFSEGTEVITGNPTTKKCDGEYTSWCGIKIKTTDIQNRFDKIVDKAMDNDQLDLSNDTRAFIKSSKELGDEFRKNLFDF